MIARSKVEVMLAQTPRVLPRILAAVRVHDREVRTYALLDGYPLRLSKKYQTVVFRDDGTTEVKNSTDVETEALRSHEHRVQDERIQHQMQQLETQLRRRRAAQFSTIASALVMIERNPRDETYDASGSESSEDSGFDLLSTPRQTDTEPEHVIGESSSDDDKHYDPNNRLCPDGVPGCTCGSEYNLAWDLNNMWRNHQLGNLTAEAAQVIQQEWKEQCQRR
jgi:hypothetical protein